MKQYKKVKVKGEDWYCWNCDKVGNDGCWSWSNEKCFKTSFYLFGLIRIRKARFYIYKEIKKINRNIKIL